MLGYQVTYKLSNGNGTTTYISQPFKTEKEAKKELFEQLEHLEKDGELKNMTYCNVVYEPELPPIRKIPIVLTKFPKPLHDFLSEIFENGRPVKSKINLKKINKKMKKLELKRRKIDAKIEATKDLIMPPKTKRIDSVQELFEQRECYLGNTVKKEGK